MSNDKEILVKLDAIVAQLERIEEKQDMLAEGQERLEESIANVSLPGSNFQIEHYED
jgi:hypothetical protein